jgi:hypothetical protein
LIADGDKFNAKKHGRSDMSLKQRFFSFSILTLLLTAISIPIQNATAGTFIALDPRDYTRAAGTPDIKTDSFSVYNPNTMYIIYVYNGGKNDEYQKRVSSAVIILNDSLIILPKDFNQNVSVIERPVTLKKDNELNIELRSAPGSGLTLEIIGIDDEPPQISAIVTPEPNAYVWHNTDVTVEFVCSDTISGIMSCTDPVLIQTEDSAQVISGTAVDYAGNTASTSVVINLDKSAPLVTIASPLPESTLGTTPADVRGMVIDSLSGIDVVMCNGIPSSWSVLTDSFSIYIPLTIGQNIIDVKAADAAGNVGDSIITITYSPKYTADTVAYELIEKFAPQLRFDSGNWTCPGPDNYPMSAQTYYDSIVVKGNPNIKYYNSNRNTVANNQVPTYWQATLCGKQVRIIYCWFYGYQFDADCVSGEHHGDWEHIMVILSEDKTRVVAVTYFQHSGWYTRIVARNGFGLYNGTHPVVFPGRTQHGSYHDTQTAVQTALYFDDHRDGGGPWLNSWLSPLIELQPSSTGGKLWMDADLVGNFSWGHNGISTHPTKDYKPECAWMTCNGGPANFFGTNGCQKSQCEAGDRDTTFDCWHCQPGHVDWGLICVNDCWAYPFCHSHGIKAYSIKHHISIIDAGLLYKVPW